MGEVTHSLPVEASKIRLADELPLVVGELVVEPASRQVRKGDREETLEPRVMQVLVALARARGSVVSHDELIETCWSGRIVGEDAIHRVLSRLRAVAAEIGGGSFHIETIRGVGYRLREGARTQPKGVGFSRRSLVGMSSVAVVGALGGIGALLLHKTPSARARATEYYELTDSHRGQDSVEQMEQNAALLREATRIDPKFADAWTGLALTYRALLEYGPRPDAARLAWLSRSAALRGLALDPGNVSAKLALLLDGPFRGNWEAYERGLRNLLSEHPHDGSLQLDLGFDLCEVGRWKDAADILSSFAAQRPLEPLTFMLLVEALYSTGMNEEGDDVIELARTRFPRRTHFWVVHMRNLIGTGRLPEALAFAGDLALRPDDEIDPRIDFEIWVAQALSKGTIAARANALSKISSVLHQKPAMLEAGAHSASVLGSLDAAFAMLEGFYFGQGPWGREQWDHAHTRVLFWPGTAPMRSDPRFAAMIRGLGLDHYWRSTGTVPDYRRRQKV